ncbi:MAG TPA: pyridoxal phosphate-dependent aminotransferase [Terriglobia bacterium]|nr:pyridoxal phosphate-dependent aminotransferase [Terriglobia bacterium]
MFASRTSWPQVPNRLSQVLDERRRQGLPILDLTESNPTRCDFTYKAGEILTALADPRSLSYDPQPRGLLAAREAIAAYYAERGINVDVERIFLTTSTSEAYAYVFRLLANPGDNILVPSPGYPLFEILGGLNDLEAISYPLVYDHGWHMQVETLRDRVNARTRAIVVVHPNNPTGSFVKNQELKLLLECCRERSLALIADEVFADYAFESDEKRVTTHAQVADALTFTLSGLSKISALPQMKLAWVVVNGPGGELQQALSRLEFIADAYLSVSAPLAHALPELLETRRAIQPQILNRVRANLRHLDSQLAPGTPVSRLETEGGWYAILRLPTTRSDDDWAIEFLSKDGVLVHPGHFYDFASEGYVVLSLLPRPEEFAEGIRKILARVAECI